MFKKLATTWLLITSIAFINCLHAYDFKMKFGKINVKNLKMSVYPLDSGAEAVILGDVGITKFVYQQNEGGFDWIFERHVRIKIINKNGYGWANFEIPLYHSTNSAGKETVSSIKGYTFNIINGKTEREKLSKKNIFEEEKSENWDVVKFSMPNVKEGSIIDVTYEVTSDYLLNLQPWEFQKAIPVVWSEYQVEIPEYFNYLQFTQGHAPLYKNETTNKWGSINFVSKYRTSDRYTTRTNYSTGNVDYQISIYRFVGKDMPALKYEKFITRPDDFFTKIEFQLATVQWPREPVEKILEVTKTLLESDDFGRQINRSNFFRNELTAIQEKSENKEQEIAAIFDFVRNNIKWNGKSSCYTSQNIKKVLSEGTGNSAEINLLLIAMLREAGFAANPVILSTRDHGRIHPVYPILSKYNYVIAHLVIDDKAFLIDATDPFIPFGHLPARCVNLKGRLITNEGSTWIDLQKTCENQMQFIKAEFDMDQNQLTGSINRSCTGYLAADERKKIIQNGEEAFIEDIKKEHKDWEISNCNIKKVKDLNEPLTNELDVKISGNLESAGNIIFIDPFIFVAPFSDLYQVTINIPEEYEIDELPEKIVYALPDNDGIYSYNILQTKNKISITSNLSIKKAFFNAKEYQALRQFFDLIVAKQAEKIVLKKI